MYNIMLFFNSYSCALVKMMEDTNLNFSRHQLCDGGRGISLTSYPGLPCSFFAAMGKRAFSTAAKKAARGGLGARLVSPYLNVEGPL